MITPNSDIILIKSPLELTEKNQITFANTTAQYNYFASLPHTEINGATYQRKDGFIRFPASYDSIVEYNYVMYRNTNYSNKWFFAFIEKMAYQNDNVTDVYIKEDVYQSWMFNFDFKQTFVEREHTNNDAIGANIIPEGLGTGEYTAHASTKHEFNYSNSSFDVCFLVTELSGGIPSWTTDKGRYYNGIWSGLWSFSVDYSNAQHVINAYTSVGKLEAIQSIYIMPSLMRIAGGWTSDSVTMDDTTFNVHTPPIDKSSYLVEAHDFNRPTTLDSYTPRNNKLFTYPYCFLYADNNAGQVVNYNFEDFANKDTVRFVERGVVGQGCSIKLVPVNYKNFSEEEAYTYGLTAAKLPVCAWTGDYYTAYMVQNGLNIGLNLASSAISMASGAGSNVSPLPLISGVEKIANTLTDIYKASIAPDQAYGNTTNSDINVGSKKGITVYVKTVKYEVAKSIDDFFSMFGYATKQVKIPNITGRRNWNYVKTVDAYVGGDVPQDSMDEFKSMLNSGLTFWHNPSTFMDYSQNNDII